MLMEMMVMTMMLDGFGDGDGDIGDGDGLLMDDIGDGDERGCWTVLPPALLTSGFPTACWRMGVNTHTLPSTSVSSDRLHSAPQILWSVIFGRLKFRLPAVKR